MTRGCWSLAGLLALLTGAMIGFAPADGADPVAALVGSAAATPSTPPLAPTPDPFPIRRVFATGDRLNAVLVEEAKGRLIRLPQGSFENRVRAASAAAPSPRIAEANYEATLERGGLNGTATWRVAGGGLLDVDPWNFATGAGRWADGRSADLFRGDSTYLAVERSGDSRVALPWSVRATEEPAADRFELAFPSAAVSHLLLTVPNDRTPEAAKSDVLITGPFPGPSEDRKVWRLAFGGRSKFELAVHRPGRGGEPPPAYRVDRALRYDLAPGLAVLTAEFGLEQIRGVPSDLAFLVDSSLRVTNVSGGNRLTWAMEPPANAGTPNRLRVGGYEAGGRITVTAEALVPPASDGWPCPLIRLADGLPGADSLEVRFDPELAFHGLEPGDYRATGASFDRGYRLKLIGTLAASTDPRIDRRPPVMKIRSAEAEFVSTDDVTWTVVPGSSELTARFKLRINCGPLVQIPIRTAGGLTLGSAALSPSDPGLTWKAIPSAPGEYSVEPSHPLAAGQSVELLLHFRGPATVPAGDSTGPSQFPLTIPFPRVALGGAVEREGTFHIVVPPGLRAWPSLAPPTPGTLTYPFRGRSPEGSLAVLASVEGVAGDRDVVVAFAAGKLKVTNAIALRSEEAPLGTVTVFTPSVPGVTWDVRGPASSSVRRTPWLPWLLGSGWSALTNAASGTLLAGDLWSVRLDRPSSEVALAVRSEHVAPVGAAAIPLPSVLGVRLASPKFALAASDESGFEPPAVEPGFPERFRLTPRGERPKLAAKEWSFEKLSLAVRIEADGSLACGFTGSILEAGGAFLPIGLPAGAKFAGAKIAGRTADVRAVDSTVLLPVPNAQEGSREFEIRYVLTEASGPTSWVRPPVVEFAPPRPTLPNGESIEEIRWSSAETFRLWPRLDGAESAQSDATPAVAVRSKSLRALGYALAALVLGGFVSLARRIGRRRGLALVPLLVACGLAALLAPDGWGVLLRPPSAVAFLGYVLAAAFAKRRGASPVEASSSRRKLPSTLSLVRLVFAVATGVGVGNAATAQAPESPTIYVISGPAAAPSQLSVLAPPALLVRLDSFGNSALPAAAIAAADYEGTAEGSGPATFAARFRVVATGAGDAPLWLPLAGVRLIEVLVDGKAAFPESPKPDRYTVRIPGPGVHEVAVRFAVSVAIIGGDREARFGCPDVPNSRVRFAAPQGGRGLDVPTRRGTQTVTGGRQKADADHGGGTIIAVRWRGEASGANASVAVRDVCVWDLTEAGEIGTAAFAFRVTGGSVTRLNVLIPDSCEPSKPTVRSDLDGPGLRDWRVTPSAEGFQTLSVGLQGPVEGQVVIVVRLIPKRAGMVRPVLRYPRPPKEVSGEGFAVVRTKGLTIEDLPRSPDLIDFPAETMVREFAGLAPELELDRFPPNRVFQRASATLPELRPVLRPSIEPAVASNEIAWTLSSRASVEGTVKLARPSGTVSLEFEVPNSILLDEVRCPDLQSWNRTGSRVQIWLKKSTRDAVVRWSGVWKGYSPAGGNGGVVELPLPRGPASSATPVVRVRTTDGWSAVANPSRGVAVQPNGAQNELSVLVDPAIQILRIAVIAPGGSGSASVRESHDGIRYQAAVHLAIPAGRVAAFNLVLNGVPLGSEPIAKGPEGVRIGPPEIGPGQVRWSVSVPATLREPMVLTATAKVARVGRLPEPELSVGGLPAAWSERTFEANGGSAVVEGPFRWRATGPNRWAADGPRGAWSIAVPAGPPEQSKPPSRSKGEGALESSDERASLAQLDYALAVAWLLAFLALAAFAALGRASLGPERLLGCGLIAAVAMGWESTSGTAFLIVAGVGLAGRGFWVAYRLAGLMLR